MELKEVMMGKPINTAALETVKARARVKVKKKGKEKAREMASSNPAGSSQNMEFANLAMTADSATIQKTRDEPGLER